MNTRVPLLVSLALVAAMAAAGLLAWHLLPPGTLVAVHWGIDGKPNGYARGGFGFFVIPAVAAAVTLRSPWCRIIEPRRFNLAASAKFYVAGWIGAMLLTALAQAVIVTNALFRPIDGRAAITAALSALPSSSWETISARRVPTSSPASGRHGRCSTDISWEKTHRLGGRLFIATGAITLAILVIGGSALAMKVLLPSLLALIGVSVAMSYVYWKRKPDRQKSGNRAGIVRRPSLPASSRASLPAAHTGGLP